MGIYEMVKDAAKVAQKADNVELVQKLLDVQKMALDMQEKEYQLKLKISDLEAQNAELQEMKKYHFAEGTTYYVDSDSPNRPLCPVCTVKLKSPVPLNSMNFCIACDRAYM